MLERFWALDPLARRAVTAVGLFGLMFIVLLFPTCDFTVWLFFTLSTAFLWAIGILRPFLVMMYYLLQTVLRIKTRPWWW
ncbi:hypothetical protein LJ656_32365 [Paraburkholderia sp. MMS20-SJTR3]|uniref:Intracellular multiplication protein IcmT n=1 Tax=Paraburkholderia sejongensis TaxID=2886946 RepID=A0ABS8K544_9BURK|nr:hypothetical protein [Paraburkholderia sp. MMS20-SJTR3]MCC8397270.1 hypothetical protein [Paraburkholderia sp. MMS20-SJTR3]